MSMALLNRRVASARITASSFGTAGSAPAATTASNQQPCDAAARPLWHRLVVAILDGFRVPTA
ncbi:MAG: hypothetical protein K1X57_07080 [Gemmataceae bacterium]|nr:hypothetical protein [Gemmataceae bacterium]